eukprot:CAMPEP_0197182934 /NCGR_PEP_ID=MMETSP1423-20130617/7065_1 /TAXON_ID=476441 /ORGANISM="Pseudo-nitzschia heimii, Strain UNC1101" /LENGTH=440 /DNA_ID=CAMNT_0042633439 /DNA_START=47 /DNA_END=1369 /DNA_ORIENTATION=+
MVSSDDQSVSMQKWGIPEDGMLSVEVTLLERLVWVPYKEHWWPALLYSNYTELQDYLYDKLDVLLKAQFASAIMRQLNDPKPIKIARLLGRQMLEVVEVAEGQYAEFYWQLPKVLPMACRKSKYGNDTELYLDFHRALDQVEEIIRDVSGKGFIQGATGQKKTWIQRAEEALTAPRAATSVNPNYLSDWNSIKASNNRGLSHDQELVMQEKDAIDQEESNFLFNALDGMFEQCNSTYDHVAGYPDYKMVEKEVKPDYIPKASLLAVNKQKDTRDSLRKALSRQRQLRESGSDTFSNKCVVDDDDEEVRTPMVENDISVVQSPSTEVLPNSSGDDTVLWKLLNFGNENDQEKRYGSNEIPLDPSRSAQDPEMVGVMPVKKMSVQPMHGQSPTDTAVEPIESREESHMDDREAVMAAARAAAAVELDVTFWEHLTCSAMESH